jgi:hypothetical protein
VPAATTPAFFDVVKDKAIWVRDHVDVRKIT